MWLTGAERLDSLNRVGDVQLIAHHVRSLSYHHQSDFEAAGSTGGSILWET